MASMATSQSGHTLLLDSQNNLYVMSNATDQVQQVTYTDGTAAKVSDQDLGGVIFKGSLHTTTGGFCLDHEVNGKMVYPCSTPKQSNTTGMTSKAIGSISTVEATQPMTTTGGLCLWRCTNGKWANICEKAPKTKPTNTTMYVGGPCSNRAAEINPSFMKKLSGK
jgi:hypothetical protein